MTTKDPYADSPYDASGMPLATTVVDYDVKEDVAKATVKDKVEKNPESINDIDYTPRPIDKKLLPQKLDKDKFNSAIKDNVNNGHPFVKEIDFEEATLDTDDPKAVKEEVEKAPVKDNEKVSKDEASFLDEKEPEKGKK